MTTWKLFSRWTVLYKLNNNSCQLWFWPRDYSTKDCKAICTKIFKLFTAECFKGTQILMTAEMWDWTGKLVVGRQICCQLWEIKVLFLIIKWLRRRCCFCICKWLDLFVFCVLVMWLSAMWKVASWTIRPLASEKLLYT